MTASQETSTLSSSITGSVTITVEGVGKPSSARFTQIEELLDEFLTRLEPTNAWHVTLKATQSA